MIGSPSNGGRRQRIGAAFGAAEGYDHAARVQARVAGRLAARIAALPLPAAPRVLEIGCGTGFLTEALIARGVGGEWLVSDLVPAMVARARARVGDGPGRQFAVLDGEHGPRPDDAPFDLICSSLAFQWFDDPGRAAARLMDWLAPGGWLVFTTLAEGTFAEWRAANGAVGAQAGTPPFPSLAALRALFPEAEVSGEIEVEQHVDAAEFLRGVKAIGAGTPAAGHRPLSPRSLTAAMRAFEAAGARASYEVATVMARK